MLHFIFMMTYHLSHFALSSTMPARDISHGEFTMRRSRLFVYSERLPLRILIFRFHWREGHFEIFIQIWLLPWILLGLWLGLRFKISISIISFRERAENRCFASWFRECICGLCATSRAHISSRIEIAQKRHIYHAIFISFRYEEGACFRLVTDIHYYIEVSYGRRNKF